MLLGHRALVADVVLELGPRVLEHRADLHGGAPPAQRGVCRRDRAARIDRHEQVTAGVAEATGPRRLLTHVAVVDDGQLLSEQLGDGGDVVGHEGDDPHPHLVGDVDERVGVEQRAVVASLGLGRERLERLRAARHREVVDAGVVEQLAHHLDEALGGGLELRPPCGIRGDGVGGHGGVVGHAAILPCPEPRRDRHPRAAVARPPRRLLAGRAPAAVSGTPPVGDVAHPELGVGGERAAGLVHVGDRAVVVPVRAAPHGPGRAIPLGRVSRVSRVSQVNRGGAREEVVQPDGEAEEAIEAHQGGECRSEVAGLKPRDAALRHPGQHGEVALAQLSSPTDVAQRVAEAVGPLPGRVAHAPSIAARRLPGDGLRCRCGRGSGEARACGRGVDGG